MHSIEQDHEREAGIDLRISFSEIAECDRIRQTLGKLPWLKERGYSPSLPQSIQEMVDNGDQIGDDAIESAVHREFDVAVYEKESETLRKAWDENSKVFIAFLKTLSLPLPQEYSVLFTRYGTGGSYDLPNSVIVNISSQKSSMLTKIMHEIVHLTIESLVQTHNVDHWTKERLVDLTLGTFLGQHIEQHNPKHSDQIDVIFNEHFPDISKIIEMVGD